jgi:hypothetical protein
MSGHGRVEATALPVGSHHEGRSSSKTQCQSGKYLAHETDNTPNYQPGATRAG